jgi:pyruvate dehydrogenase E2 component (dihydrolipoamide acetyltransferase)
MSNDVWVITMPKLGETVTEGTVGGWLKQVGETVELDDPLFEVSTDKVDSEVPSPYDGVVIEILVPAGETVPVGTPLARIGAPGSVPVAGGSDPTEGGSEGPATAATDGPSHAVAAATASATALADAGQIHEVSMPKLGETVTEGTVGSWLKQLGDTVAFDDPLLEVSTDKVDSEIPSPFDGTVLEIVVAAGETVPVGTVLARIGEPGTALSAPGTTGSAPAAAAPTGAKSVPAPAHERRPGTLLSPVVRRLAAEHGLDLAQIRGTSSVGRITRRDVEQAIKTVGLTEPSPARAAPASAAGPAATATPAAAGAAGDPRDQVVPLSRIRLLTADLMVRSLTTSAHVWTSVEVDFEAIEKVRRVYKERFRAETGASLSYLPFIARATCDALRAYPVINSSIDIAAKTMTKHPYVNLGIAVDLDEQGLVVPVVKDADSLNIRGVASRIATLAAAARNKKIGMADMSGSTFTITNPGPFSSYASSPVINQPNVAILCTDGVTRRPVAVGDAIAIHAMGIIGLVYDHRAFDGSTASKFLRDLRDSLQDRNWEAELS